MRVYLSLYRISSGTWLSSTVCKAHIFHSQVIFWFPSIYILQRTISPCGFFEIIFYLDMLKSAIVETIHSISIDPVIVFPARVQLLIFMKEQPEILALEGSSYFFVHFHLCKISIIVKSPSDIYEHYRMTCVLVACGPSSDESLCHWLICDMNFHQCTLMCSFSFGKCTGKHSRQMFSSPVRSIFSQPI